MSTKTFFTICLMLLITIGVQAQEEPTIEQKGEHYIISLNGKKVELKTNSKNGKKVLAGRYMEQLFGKNTGKPDKNKPLESDRIAYIHGLGLVGFTLQKDNPRNYFIKDHKNNFQEGKSQYLNPAKLVEVEVPLNLPKDADEVGFINWVHDLHTGKTRPDLHTVGYETFIIRKGIDATGILADKTFYFGITANKPFNRISKAEAHLYHRHTKVKSWNVENLRQNVASVKANSSSSYYILPNFIIVDKREDNGYMQFGVKNDQGEIDLVTINPELEVSSVRKNVYFISTLEDHPDLPYETIIPNVTVGSNRLFPFPTGRRYRKLVFSPFFVLEQHPDLEGIFLPINSKGEYMLQDDNIIGVTPITMVANQQNTRAIDENSGDFRMVVNWMIGYQHNNEFLWGWASPEFGYITPPIWKDWNLHEYDDDPKTESYRKFKIKEGQYSVSVKMFDGPILVNQLLDNSWQMYVQPNLIDFSATFDQPNTFAGKIPGGKSHDEAFKKGEQWLSGTSRKINAEYSRALKPIAAEMLQKANEDFKEAEISRKNWEAQLEYYKKNPIPERRYTTSASYKGLEPSFTNKLRNTSRTNSSNMSTKSLNKVTNQIRQAKGKGYKN